MFEIVSNHDEEKPQIIADQPFENVRQWGRQHSQTPFKSSSQFPYQYILHLCMVVMVRLQRTGIQFPANMNTQRKNYFHENHIYQKFSPYKSSFTMKNIYLSPGMRKELITFCLPSLFILLQMAWALSVLSVSLYKCWIGIKWKIFGHIWMGYTARSTMQIDWSGGVTGSIRLQYE